MLINAILFDATAAISSLALLLSSSSSSLSFPPVRLDGSIVAPPPPPPSHRAPSEIVVGPSSSRSSIGMTPSTSSSSSYWPSLRLASTASSTSTTTRRDDDDVIPIPADACVRQYDNADDIPPSSYAGNEVIRGKVVKVIDGDTIRIRHAPSAIVDPVPCQRLPSAARGGGDDDIMGCDDYDGSDRLLARCTIKVRLYGVDAPEISRRRDGIDEPYSREATAYVTDVAYDRMVEVKVLGKDRYDRVIGRVTIEGRGGGNGGGRGTSKIDGEDGEDGEVKDEEECGVVDLSYGLLVRGYATLYTRGGAKYDGRRIEMEGIMDRAMDEGRGIWGVGKEGREDI